MKTKKNKGSEKLSVSMSNNTSRERRAKRKAEFERQRTQQKKRQAKQWVGFDSMLEGGQAYLGDNQWSSTLVMSDVSYKASDTDQQAHIVNEWASVLNMLVEGQQAQVTVRSRQVNIESLAHSVEMPLLQDANDKWRTEFNTLLKRQIGRATSGTLVEKLLTLTVEDDDPQRAVASLNRLVLQVSARLASMGCHVKRLDRTQRLRAIHDALMPDDGFHFSEEEFAQSKTDTRDYVTPWAFDLRDPSCVHILESEKDFYHTSIWVRDFPPRLSDELVSRITALKGAASINIHLSPFERGAGIDLVKQQKTSLDMEIADRRQRNIREHQPADYLPPNLEEASEQVEDLLDKLNSSDEKMIDALVVIGVDAPDKSTLYQRVLEVRQILSSLSLQGDAMRHMQLPALVCTLPLGARPVPVRRTLTTSAAAIMIPFTSEEHFDPTGVFYGTNKLSGNLIVVDRTKLLNQNGFILGTTGSGKSAATKWEIEHVLLTRPYDQVIIIDPEGEYEKIRNAFGGALVDVSAGSSQRLNPLEITLNSDNDEDPIRERTSSVMGMMNSLIGGVNGLSPQQEGVLDDVVTQMYQSYNPQLKQPTLGSLHELLTLDERPEAQQLSNALIPFVNGSKSGFNGQTNVNANDRLVVFNTLHLDGSMKTFGMMVVLQHVWNRIKDNRAKGKGRIWIYVDEFHTLFSNKYAADFFLSIYKRARKYGAGITGITQNIEELLESHQARLMLSNSSFLELLRMNATDAQTVKSLLKLSDTQVSLFATGEPGTGLIAAGDVFVPFDGRIPRDNPIFELNQTNAASQQR